MVEKWIGSDLQNSRATVTALVCGGEKGALCIQSGQHTQYPRSRLCAVSNVQMNKETNTEKVNKIVPQSCLA